MLDVAEDLLLERQPAGLTVEALAQAAGTSKTTIYSWFEGIDGVYSALVTRQAGRILAGWDPSVPVSGEDLRERLLRIAEGLLDMLTDEVSVALHRVAMTQPGVARVVLDRGRHQAAGLVEALVAGAHSKSLLQAPDPRQAFVAFYGLVVADRQIRVLLGEPRPAISVRRSAAVQAVDQFLQLHTV